MKTPVTPSFYVQDDSAETTNPNSSLFRGVRDIVQLDGEKRAMEYERYGWGFLVFFFRWAQPLQLSYMGDRDLARSCGWLKDLRRWSM